MANEFRNVWTLASFAGLVRKMRTAQKVYHRRKRTVVGEALKGLLEEAIALERQVDRAVDEVEDGLPLFDREGAGGAPGL